MRDVGEINGRILGQCIRQSREELQEQDPKWTQHYVGEAAGLDPEHYSKIERGKYPQTSFVTVGKIAKVLNCSLDTLFANYEKGIANYNKNRLGEHDDD
ncbi:helix-turn-helix domain-containing protein [Gracilibacillus massiliensis]|uniref:helix-turn-helix domain-containing protein n=1 Tax=Gracilibacillus massiliensis TaxID=1564956 RepID=UPI00071C5891|nr:helix-turn-helix transcriptional regulator [Gracilibacillus massiliensis]